MNSGQINKWRAAWTSPDHFATTLLQLFVDRYGTEAFDWDAHTILYHIENDFDLTMPTPNFDRLMVAINLCTTDTFYKSCPDFINFCNILSGDTFDPNMWDPADAAECAWGITEGMLIWPPDKDDDAPFSPEITAYIGKVLDAEGIIHPPGVLRIATDRRHNLGSVPDTYTDDPVMFTAISDFEDQKTSAIERLVRANLTKISTQLGSLPLQMGDAQGAVKKVFGELVQAK